MSFELPSNAPVTDADNTPSVPFLQWFSRIHAICLAAISNGTTANRPTKNLWVGRPYFDTTLGLPIWWNGTAWINSGATFIHASATLDFPSIPANGMQDQTLTVTGAATGDRVVLAAPSTLNTALTFCGYVTAANTVTIHLHNTSGGAIDPPAATWGVTVFRAT